MQYIMSLFKRLILDTRNGMYKKVLLPVDITEDQDNFHQLKQVIHIHISAPRIDVLNVITYDYDTANDIEPGNHEQTGNYSKAFGMPMLDLRSININKELLILFDKNIMIKYEFLPIGITKNTVFVAVHDPKQIQYLYKSTLSVGNITYVNKKFSYEPILVDRRLLVNTIRDIAEECRAELIIKESNIKRLFEKNNIDTTRINFYIREGEPYQEIIKVAKTHKSDAIIMVFSKDSDGETRLGFTQLQVLKHAPCSVLLISP